MSADAQPAGERLVSRVDHLVVVADTLEQGVDWCRATLGVAPVNGGRHPSMGTHNRVMRIGGPAWPNAYLEIIAIEPGPTADDAARPARWFGMDEPALRDAVRRTPRLVHFVAQTSDIDRACEELARLGEDVGQPVAASRSTPEAQLRWRITLRADGRPQLGGRLPALIEWQGRHPVEAMEDCGVRLQALRVRRDRRGAVQRAWSAIGLEGLATAIEADAPLLEAVFSTPRGGLQTIAGGFE